AYLSAKTMPRSCFVAGTLVLAASGLVAIENIKAGDKVISTNPKTFETAEKVVLRTYIRDATAFVDLKINGETITTTTDHPFYVKNKGFVNAGRLEVGSELVSSSGELFLVERIQFDLSKVPITVYNLHIEGYHTYFVGNTHVFVHNANYNERMGRQHGNAPRDNRKQNEQVRAVVKKLGLTKSQKRELHDSISREGLGYQEVLEAARELFGL
ncbi:MAG: HINT domain-containing protein, partial [Coriobacteriia bacterium]|nr:HINT domain-containing protein [Coriobacteriia bacterium]